MTMTNTESLSNSFNETWSVFYCPKSPQFIWDLHHTTSFKIILAITSIACPFTISLNLLVIMVVKTRRELKKVSNMLLPSVALADLLVGAVSMPLSVTLDTLVINKVLNVDIICAIDFISVSVLHIGCWASFFHLLVIAWARYMATAKWSQYKAIITTGRVNRYTRVAWLLTLLIVIPVVIMGTVSAPDELILVINVILSIFWFVCLSLIAYFYAKAYLTVRKCNRTRIRSEKHYVPVKENLESKLARMTFWLTVFFAVSSFPLLVVYLFQGVLPFFRRISTIRWAETIFQLNSLANPLLYWYRNGRLRKATLGLLRYKNRPATHTRCHIRQRGYSLASLDIEKLQNKQTGARLVRSESHGAMICLDTFRQRRNETMTQRPLSAPLGVASDEIFTQQRNQLIVTIQIENAPGGKSIQRKTKKQNGKTRKTARSASLGDLKLHDHIDGEIVRSRSRSE